MKWVIRVVDLDRFLQRASFSGVACVGDVYCVGDDACPAGGPNCRHCGDSDFEQLCRSKGHCPQCGVGHGVAGVGRLAARGLHAEPEASYVNPTPQADWLIWRTRPATTRNSALVADHARRAEPVVQTVSPPGARGIRLREP